MRRQQRGKEKTHLGGQCCTGAPRRGIARGHHDDGGYDDDARGGHARADRGLLSGSTLLCSARSGVRRQGDEAHLPGGGGEQPLDHYPYGGERVVSAEQTPRKGIIWSRMTASAVAIGARLKGCVDGAERSRAPCAGLHCCGLAAARI